MYLFIFLYFTYCSLFQDTQSMLIYNIIVQHTTYKSIIRKLKLAYNWLHMCDIIYIQMSPYISQEVILPFQGNWQYSREWKVSLPACSCWDSVCSTASELILISVMINTADFPIGSQLYADTGAIHAMAQSVKWSWGLF